MYCHARCIGSSCRGTRVTEGFGGVVVEGLVLSMGLSCRGSCLVEGTALLVL